MSGPMLFAADYVPVRDIGRYGVLIFIIYFTGIIVMIPIAARWCENVDDKSSNLSQFLSKFVSLVRNNYGTIFFICILWPLTPVYFWLFSKFSFFEVFYFVGALTLGFVAVDAARRDFLLRCQGFAGLPQDVSQLVKFFGVG
ncbi:MAG: hypothetical protein ABJN26_12580 [Stappiaceae bacterium]